MPLASKDGKLYVKDGKLCTSCCNQGSAGACCFLNDLGEYECRSTSESRCNELGGNWYEDEECKSEDNPDGIDCSPPTTGACCYIDGSGNQSCDVTSAIRCNELGGNWYEGQECKTDANPDGIDCSDPPPPLLGCCYVDIGDGTLQSQGRTTKGDCQASQDVVDPSIDCVWIADTEETKDQPCPDQPVYPTDPIGCCYSYVDDTDGKPDFTISKDTRSGCEQAQQDLDPSYEIVWSELEDPDAECPENPPEPTGACCYLDGEGKQTCEATSESQCSELGGSWHERKKCKSDDSPDGIDCSEPTGACCFLDENGEYDCELTTESTCNSREGAWNEGKECISDNPDGMDCSQDCFNQYDESFGTYEDAEEHWAESYAPYGWSKVGGTTYDPDTDTWNYTAVCCQETTYDDQGREWCGPITRSNPLP